MSNVQRQDHVGQLALNLGCLLVQKPKLDGMHFVEYGYVEGPTITNQIEYLTMLHELGHFAHGHTQGRPASQMPVWGTYRPGQFYFENGVLRSEAQAWDWALVNCLEPIEPESRTFMWDTCLGSYLKGAIYSMGTLSRIWNGNRHYVQFVYDTPSEYFFKVRQMILEDT